MNESTLLGCSRSIADEGFLGPEQSVVTPDDQLKVSPADTNKKRSTLDDLYGIPSPDAMTNEDGIGEFPFDNPTSTEPKEKAFESV